FTLALAELDFGDGGAPDDPHALPAPAAGERRKARVAKALTYAAGHPARLARAWAKLARTARDGEPVSEWMTRALPMATLLSAKERVALRVDAARRLAATHGDVARTLLDNAEPEADEATKREIAALRRKLPARPHR
ncbi:MAG: hypothetical protein HOO96_37755, partial [Polyangiaceae bacterium]|nr:hypothetical protein [Polyangiaceae bacterium]